MNTMMKHTTGADPGEASPCYLMLHQLVSLLVSGGAHSTQPRG